MRINNKKTQILYILGSTESPIRALIHPEGDGKIDSGESLKIVGFWFGSRPDVTIHVRRMTTKFYGQLWVVRHLKRVEVPAADIHQLCNALVSPVLDFAVPAYHPLLTKEQSDNLECWQRRAFKIIYGWAYSYSENLELRQAQLCDQFAKKASVHPRFGPE